VRNSQFRLDDEGPKHLRRLVELGDDLLVKHSGRDCILEQVGRLSAAPRRAASIGFSHELQLKVQVDFDANVLLVSMESGTLRVTSIWPPPETLVSMPFLECAG
jgi:hypothetical protein